MNLAGGNNPCGTEKPDRDASDLGEIISAEQKSKIEMNLKRRDTPKEYEGNPKEYEDIPL